MINWNLVKFLSISYGKNASSNVALTIEISLLISPLRVQACCIFMISKIKFTLLLTNFHVSDIFFIVTRTLQVTFQWLLYCPVLSQPQQHGTTIKRRSNARNFSLRNSSRVWRPIYIVNSIHKTRLSVQFYFKSLHRLKNRS